MSRSKSFFLRNFLQVSNNSSKIRPTTFEHFLNEWVIPNFFQRFMKIVASSNLLILSLVLTVAWLGAILGINSLDRLRWRFLYGQIIHELETKNKSLLLEREVDQENLDNYKEKIDYFLSRINKLEDTRTTLINEIEMEKGHTSIAQAALYVSKTELEVQLNLNRDLQITIEEVKEKNSELLDQLIAMQNNTFPKKKNMSNSFLENLNVSTDGLKSKFKRTQRSITYQEEQSYGSSVEIRKINQFLNEEDTVIEEENPLDVLEQSHDKNFAFANKLDPNDELIESITEAETAMMKKEPVRFNRLKSFLASPKNFHFRNNDTVKETCEQNAKALEFARDESKKSAEEERAIVKLDKHKKIIKFHSPSMPHAKS